jgi:hypothetical protein
VNVETSKRALRVGDTHSILIERGLTSGASWIGSADVALLGQRPEDGQLQVMVQDARTGERLAFVWF